MKYLSLLVLVITVSAAPSWTETENAIEAMIENGIFSGCVLAVASDNNTLYKKAFGTVVPKRGFFAPAVTVDMKFDINYLTQVIGVNSALMEMYDQNKINTTNKAGALFFDFNNNGKSFITLQNLLEHNSGSFYLILGLSAFYTGAYPKTPTELLKAINTLKLEYTTESKSIYS